jgi:hypothetical protein
MATIGAHNRSSRPLTSVLRSFFRSPRHHQPLVHLIHIALARHVVDASMAHDSASTQHESITLPMTLRPHCTMPPRLTAVDAVDAHCSTSAPAPPSVYSKNDASGGGKATRAAFVRSGRPKCWVFLGATKARTTLQERRLQ